MTKFSFFAKAMMLFVVIGFWGCSKEDPEKATPQLTTSVESLLFEASGNNLTQEIEIFTNRAWTAELVGLSEEWLALDKAEGDGNGVIKVTVLPNIGVERSANVKITSSILSQTIRVIQAADGAIEPAVKIYFEDCGKEVEKLESGWPYTDQFTGWIRSGELDQSAVTYSGAKANVSNSGSSFNPADGLGISGAPYVGMNTAASVFLINNINVSGKTNLMFDFASLFQSNYSGGPVFGEITPSSFELSAGFDGETYDNLTFTATKAGESNWYKLHSEFKIPEGTEKLYIKFATSSLVSNQGFRFDDFTLTSGGNGELLNPGSVTPPPPPGEKTYITLTELRAKGVRTVTEDVYVKATVVSNVDGGNNTSLKNVIVSDDKAGISIRFVANADASYKVGTELELHVKGAELAEYKGLLQLNNFANAKAVATGTVKALDPVAISAKDLLSGKYESMYVAVSDVQVAEADLKKTVGSSDAHVDINIDAKTGEKFVMFTAKYAKFITDKVPQGSGVLKGIASVVDDVYQVIPTLATDYAGMTGARFSGTTPPPPPTTKTYITVAELRAKGETTIADDVYVKATVISDLAGANFNAKSVVISDGNAGINVFLKSNNTFAVGTELELSLKDAVLSKYKGMLQLNGFDNAKAVATGTVKKLDPKVITAKDLLSGKYESMYVSIADVQVVSEDLTKTMSGNTNLETKDGDKFIMFTMSSAKFAKDNVPTKSGIIKGVGGVNNTVMQIIPTNTDDLAGMTNDRFGNDKLIFNNATFTATTIKKGKAIVDGKITIPYVNAQGTEKYTVSVAVSGDGAPGINAVSNHSVSLTKGEGNIEIPITGTPTSSGDVVFTISGIADLKTTTVDAFVETGAALVFTSNVTLPKSNGTTSEAYYADSVKVNDAKFPALKLGKSGAAGTYKTALSVTGNKTLSLFAYAWKGKKVKLEITISGGGTIDGATSKEIDLVANDGATATSPYIITNVSEADLLNFDIAGLTASSEITFKTAKGTGTGSDYRAVLFGININ